MYSIFRHTTQCHSIYFLQQKERFALLNSDGRRLKPWSPVWNSTIHSDFSLIPSEGLDVSHLDGTGGVLAEELGLVLGEIPDQSHIGARRALQHLVAAHGALPPLQVLVVGVVELVRRFGVDVVQREWVPICGTSLSKVAAEFGIRVGIIEGKPHHSAPHSAKRVSTWNFFQPYRSSKWSGDQVWLFTHHNLNADKFHQCGKL